MRIVFPRPGARVIESRSGVFNRDWLRWLREMWEGLGWSSSIPVYADLWIGGSSMGESLDLSPQGTIDGNLTAPTFGEGADTGRACEFRLPNSYIEGTDLLPFSEFLADDSGGIDPDHRVVLELSHGEAKGGEVLDQTAAETVLVGPLEVIDKVITTQFTAISGSGLLKGSVVSVRIARLGDSDARDDAEPAMLLLGVGLKYQTAGIGWEVAFP